MWTELTPGEGRQNYHRQNRDRNPHFTWILARNVRSWLLCFSRGHVSTRTARFHGLANYYTNAVVQVVTEIKVKVPMTWFKSTQEFCILISKIWARARIYTKKREIVLFFLSYKSVCNNLQDTLKNWLNKWIYIIRDCHCRIPRASCAKCWIQVREDHRRTSTNLLCNSHNAKIINKIQGEFLCWDETEKIKWVREN